MLFASMDNRENGIMVKTYVSTHRCQREWNLRRCTATWLAEKYIDSFKSDDKMTLTNFSRTVKRKWNVTPMRSKLVRVRRLALKKIYGVESELYNKLWNFGLELRSNPGSSFFLNLVDNHFQSVICPLMLAKGVFLKDVGPKSSWTDAILRQNLVDKYSLLLV
jgi:hypothetical protein